MIGVILVLRGGLWVVLRWILVLCEHVPRQGSQRRASLREATGEDTWTEVTPCIGQVLVAHFCGLIRVHCACAIECASLGVEHRAAVLIGWRAAGVSIGRTHAK